MPAEVQFRLLQRVSHVRGYSWQVFGAILSRLPVREFVVPLVLSFSGPYRCLLPPLLPESLSTLLSCLRALADWVRGGSQKWSPWPTLRIPVGQPPPGPAAVPHLETASTPLRSQEPLRKGGAGICREVRSGIFLGVVTTVRARIASASVEQTMPAMFVGRPLASTINMRCPLVSMRGALSSQ